MEEHMVGFKIHESQLLALLAIERHMVWAKLHSYKSNVGYLLGQPQNRKPRATILLVRLPLGVHKVFLAVERDFNG